MKLFLQLFIPLAFITGAKANSLLQNPTTGPLNNSKLGDICIAANATDVVLLVADQSSVYAIDIADNNASEAGANTITSIASFVTNKLTPIAGQPVTVSGMVVNPISKAVYVLASAGSSSYIFKVKNNGASITLLDLTNIKHSKMSWGGTFNVNDMTWGNNTLYISSGGFSLNGEVGWAQAPFVHNATVDKRATSMFKSNWGGSYFTDAPLETMVFGNINNTPRLMGVTTCAPGFSLDINGLSGSGILEVTEDFNVNTGMSAGVVFQKQGGKSWLYDLHDGYLYRIGEKYLDGSRIAAMEYNNNSTLLRTVSPEPAPGLTEDEFKKYDGTYIAIAAWDDSKLLALESGSDGALVLKTTITTGLNDAVAASGAISIYPNPASGIINLELPEGINKGTISVFDIQGKLVAQQQVNATTIRLDVSKWTKGNYTVSVTTTDGSIFSGTIVKE